MRNRLIQPLLWMVIPTMVAWSDGCEHRKPAHIGFVGGLSGPAADIGVSGRNGVILAVEQANQTGGVNGRRIVLTTRDDRQDPATAKQVINELLAMDLEVIIGPMTSSMAMVMVPLVNPTATFLLSPTVTTTALTGKDDSFVRIVATTGTYAATAARHQYETLGRRRAAIIHDQTNKAYTESWRDHFQKTFERLGGAVVKVRAYKTNPATSFCGMTETLFTAKPDLIVVIANAVESALICQQIRKTDKHIVIVISEWAATERFIELGGRAAEGVYTARNTDFENNSEKSILFVRSYQQRFGQKPDSTALAGYDAALVALQAWTLKKKGQSLKQALLGIKTFQCIQQSLTIDRFGDSDRQVYITTVTHGGYRKIE